MYILMIILYISFAVFLLIYIVSTNIILVCTSGMLLLILVLAIIDLNIKYYINSCDDKDILDVNSYTVVLKSAKSNTKIPNIRTIGVFRPIIMFDKNYYDSLNNNIRQALIFHEIYHIKSKSNTKRLIALALCVLIKILYLIINSIYFNYVSICFFALLFILYFILSRKSEYKADIYSVYQMQESKSLIEWLEINQLTEKRLYISLHPSFKNRIRYIKNIQYKKK